jgi:predicted HicB family RNase H-like nuclease
MIRISDDAHRIAKISAVLEGVSLEDWVSSLIRQSQPPQEGGGTGERR